MDMDVDSGVQAQQGVFISISGWHGQIHVFARVWPWGRYEQPRPSPGTALTVPRGKEDVSFYAVWKPRPSPGTALTVPRGKVDKGLQPLVFAYDKTRNGFFWEDISKKSVLICAICGHYRKKPGAPLRLFDCS